MMKNKLLLWRNLKRREIREEDKLQKHTHGQYDNPDDAIVDPAICKIAEAFESYKSDNASKDKNNDATNEDTKSKSGEGSTFGNSGNEKNQFSGKRR